MKEAQGQYQTGNDDDTGRFLRKEGGIEIPLFPAGADLLYALNQSKTGSINLSMAKGTFQVAEKLARDGAFEAKVDEFFDCDEAYDYVTVWPWEGEIGQNQPILFTVSLAKELFIRRVLMFEDGKFVFAKPFQGSNSVNQDEIRIVGVVKARTEWFG